MGGGHFSFSKMKHLFQRNEGFISAALSIAIVMVGIVAMFIFAQVGTRFKMKGIAKEQANDAGQSTFETLLNNPWSHPDLSVGSHERGLLTWTVTQIEPRLKQIDLTSKIPAFGPNQEDAILSTGYKYDDF